MFLWSQFVKWTKRQMALLIVVVMTLLVYAFDSHRPSTYVPKSQRNSVYKALTRWGSKAQQACATLKEAIWTELSRQFEGSKAKSKHRRISRLLHNIGTRGTGTNKWRHRRLTPPNYRTPLIGYQAVAMSASSGDQDGPHRKNMFDTDSDYIGIDNRASACMSDDVTDFVGILRPTKRVVKGFAGSRTANLQVGIIEWKIEDDNGKVTKHRIPNSYYVPEGGVRLLSPQHWAKTMSVATRPQKGVAPEQTFHDRVVLTWNQGRSIKTVYMDPGTNVATFTKAPAYSKYHKFCLDAQIDDDEELDQPHCLECNAGEIVTDDEADSDSDDEGTPSPRRSHFELNGPRQTAYRNTPVIVEDEEDLVKDNVSAEFLRYHHKFNHASPKRIQLMAKHGVIPKRLATCAVPVCTACMYGKATRRQWRHKSSNNDSVTSAPNVPGAVVSVDQMVSPTPGLVAQVTGTLTTARYKYATIFIDHATDFSYVYLQKSATAQETIEAKSAFERQAMEQGVTVKHYHADNGVFRSNLWAENCNQKGQGLSFAGVNAHHQNGKAERRIRELQQTARTMIIHAHRRWPSAITTNLWPYAVRMANDMLNATPSLKWKDGQTPSSKFHRSPVSANPKHWQHFGCPVYVLERNLQTAGGIHHKWSEKAKVGIYLGRSPQHAQSVALVLSLRTGLVSPQFHVSFDTTFQTMKSSFGGQPPASLWQVKAGFEESQGATETSGEILGPEPRVAQPGPSLAPPEGDIEPATGRDPEGDPEAEAHHEITWEPAWDEVENAGENAPTNVSVADEANQTTRASKRNRRPVQRLLEAMASQVYYPGASTHVNGELFSLQAMFPEDMHTDNTEFDAHPLNAFAATSDPDTMYYHEAMKAPDRKEFIQAMQEEITGQLENEVYSPILRSEVPEGATILPAVWSMKRKRKSKTGEVYRHKGRLNIGGHKQKEGLDYDQTYSPVVTWPSIRLLLTMSVLHKWHTRQIDYVQAYPQAPVERPMYMEIPKGFKVTGGATSKDYLLQIHKNIYGQRQAGRVWNKYLVEKLIRIGFHQSQHDECVFFKGRAMYVLYTDDSILAGPDPDELDSIMKQIRGVGLKITSEGGIEDFLGINVEQQPDGSYTLTQTRLIDSILEDLGLNKSNVATKLTPTASSKILSRHPESEEFDGHFHYRSVIGKLNYLEKCTRPDIAYAVHQCARFTSDPRYEHGQAVKWLGRYLYGTRTKGIQLRPSGETLDLYVDSDWSGNWDREVAATDPSTARSRHGYFLMYCGCPVFWASQLQTEIALSSTEAEYIGLSRALRETIPVMELLKEMRSLGFTITTATPQVHCRVFEDNSGALTMATVHKLRPRTKHINIKFHHFRSYVDSGEVSIHPIASDDNYSDMLTKGQPIELLRKHRSFLLGWDVGIEKGCNNTRDSESENGGANSRSACSQIKTPDESDESRFPENKETMRNLNTTKGG